MYKRQVDNAAKLVDSINALGNQMGINFTAAKDMFAWIGPVLTALQGNPVCDLDTSCSDTRDVFERLVASRTNGNLDQLNNLAHQLQGMGDKQTLNATLSKLNSTLAGVVKAVSAMGLDKPGGAQAGLTQLKQGADRLAGGIQQVAGGVDQLVEQVKVIADGLGEASGFLLTMKENASDPSQAGFNIPVEVLKLAEFQKAAKAYVSPDGHSVRYLVQTKLDPFSSAAMDQVDQIRDVAQGAQPNTCLLYTSPSPRDRS